MNARGKEYHHFRLAAGFSLFIAGLIAIFLLLHGKENSFLIINLMNSPYFDYFFQYFTYLGDGIIWIPVFLYAILFRKNFLVAILAGLLICTVLTHFCKRVIFADELRPVGVLVDKIRTIPGLRINRYHSFPSGHTSTAFTLALLLAFVIKRTFWSIFFPVVAFFVGYSRVYLAQHFVTDVCAGLVVGVISAFLSIRVFDAYNRRQKKKEKEEEVPVV